MSDEPDIATELRSVDPRDTPNRAVELSADAANEIDRLRTDLVASNARVAELEETIERFHWMARRYCDGRMTTSPGSFNDLTRKLLTSGVRLQEPYFARDGMGRDYDGLTDDEVEAARNDMPKGHAALEAEWTSRTEALTRRLGRQSAVIEAMDEALKPFAECAPEITPENARQWDRLYNGITGDLGMAVVNARAARAAKAAMAAMEGESE